MLHEEIISQIKVERELKIPTSVKRGLVLTEDKLRSLAKEEFLNEELYEPATHLLKRPGKLIRPGLIFTTAEVLGEDPEDFIDLAAGIELLHTASLVHDDILDKDSMRRGVEPVHMKFGESSAILAGDALIAKAISLASRYGERIIKRAAEAAMAMCAGEVLDVKLQSAPGPQSDLSLYLKVAELKTASLMAVSSSIVADYVKSRKRDPLYDIGLNIGMSFQIKDDIMNYLGITDKAPKSVKSDANNNRPSVISVFKNNGREDPVRTAAKLNNFYLDRANELLVSLGNADSLLQYLDFLRI